LTNNSAKDLALKYLDLANSNNVEVLRVKERIIGSNPKQFAKNHKMHSFPYPTIEVKVMMPMKTMGMHQIQKEEKKANEPLYKSKLSPVFTGKPVPDNKVPVAKLPHPVIPTAPTNLRPPGKGMFMPNPNIPEPAAPPKISDVTRIAPPPVVAPVRPVPQPPMIGGRQIVAPVFRPPPIRPFPGPPEESPAPAPVPTRPLYAPPPVPSAGFVPASNPPPGYTPPPPVVQPPPTTAPSPYTPPPPIARPVPKTGILAQANFGINPMTKPDVFFHEIKE